MFSLARGRQFLTHVLPAIIRPLRVMWNQIIGFLFLVLALAALPPAIRAARQYDGEPRSFFRLLISAVFILFMAGFGINAFWRAYKVPKLR